MFALLRGHIDIDGVVERPYGMTGPTHLPQFAMLRVFTCRKIIKISGLIFVRVSSVYMPHGSIEKDNSSATETGQDGTKTVGSSKHYICSGGSFLFTVMFTVLFYPLLVSLAVPFGILATTALVSVVIVVWCLGWIGFELLWEWRSGRLVANG